MKCPRGPAVRTRDSSASNAGVSRNSVPHSEKYLIDRGFCFRTDFPYEFIILVPRSSCQSDLGRSYIVFTHVHPRVHPSPQPDRRTHGNAPASPGRRDQFTIDSSRAHNQLESVRKTRVRSSFDAIVFVCDRRGRRRHDRN